MYWRAKQIVLAGSMLWMSWLVMMLVHESGHVVGAMGTGGKVRRVVWHPLAISRTDVFPNPHPLVEVWAGPVVGSIVPLVVAGLASLVCARIAYLFWMVAGFCLITNGAYIGMGVVWPVGDARELLRHGASRVQIGGFGLAGVAAGFWIWHRVSPRLGFGGGRVTIHGKHVYGAFAVAVVITMIGLVMGNRGL